MFSFGPSAFSEISAQPARGHRVSEPGAEHPGVKSRGLKSKYTVGELHFSRTNITGAKTFIRVFNCLYFCFWTCAATKRQDDDWRPGQSGNSWSGGGPSTASADRTSRANAAPQGTPSYSTPTWQASAASGQPPTKKPDGGYANNVIDEPNQQGLAQTGGTAAPGPRAAFATAAVVLGLLANAAAARAV